ncbi:MAG: type II secretion system F family protein, partial [Patescibacteria group bacterium]
MIMMEMIAKFRKLARTHAKQLFSRMGGASPLFHFPVSEQILFAKRLGMILRSGTPILEGLDLLHKHTASRSVSYVYHKLKEHIAKGQSLSSGLAEFPRFFGEFAVHIVRVGEITGTLPDNLNYLAEELKKRQALNKK